MKKLLLAILVLSACSHSTTTTTTGPGAPRTTTGPQIPGAPSPRLAVEEFLAAVRAQDLQAMSAVFGTSRGPSRDNMDREQLEKRLIILQCYFNHDKYRILGEAPGEASQRVFAVELTRGRLTRTPHFYTIRGPNDRWFVDNMEIAAVKEFCRESGTMDSRR
ncbi:MAG: hypothetical protein ABR582_13610 [Gemmatimonadaceae bacterium]